jgi:Flp pilus assembly pilin Flp
MTMMTGDCGTAAVGSPNLLGRFCREETGQDLIEYAILTAIVTVGSIAVFAAIRTKMSAAYGTWGTEIQDQWSPDDPIVPFPPS